MTKGNERIKYTMHYPPSVEEGGWGGETGHLKEDLPAFTVIAIEQERAFAGGVGGEGN